MLSSVKLTTTFETFQKELAAFFYGALSPSAGGEAQRKSSQN